MKASKMSRSKRSNPHNAPTALGLRAALAQVGDVIGQISELLDAKQGSAPPRDVDLSSEASRAMDQLETQVAAAWALIENRAAHIAWDSAYSEDGWPERARRLADAAMRDRDGGTAAWFEAWIAAMGDGAQEEAKRILGLELPLADWGLWLPDRAAAIQEAIELAPLDPIGAATLVGNLADVLVNYEAASAAHAAYDLLDRLAKDPSYGRAILLIVIARLLALGGDTRAAKLLDRAGMLVGGVHGELEASLSRAIATTESFLFRHGIIPESEARVDAIRAGAVEDLFAIHEFIELRSATAPASSSSASPGVIGPPALPEVQQLVYGLRSVAGSVERLDMLLEPASPMLELALATRLTEEEQFAQAERLLARLWKGELPQELRLPAAVLAVTIAEAGSHPSDELAGTLAAAGDQALWSSRPDEARGFYERSLQLRPDHPDTLRSLAEAIRLGTWGKERMEVIADLNLALHFSHSAAEIAPIGEDELWAHSLARSLYQALYRIEPGPHEDYPWRALGATLTAIAQGDTSVARFRELIVDLIAVGLMHTSAAFAELVSEAFGSSPDELRHRIYGLLNTGRPLDALPLIEGLEPQDSEDPGWIDGLRGFAYAALGDRRADEAFERAWSVGNLLLYRAWSAEHLTRLADDSAAEQWSIVWKESDLGDADSAASAAWAAIYRGALDSASRILGSLAKAERLVMSAQSVDLAQAFVRIVQSAGDEGWEQLDGRLARVMDSTNLELTRLFLRELFRRSTVARPETLVSRLDELTDTHRAALPQPSLAEDRFAMARVELARAVEVIDDEAVVLMIAQLRAAIGWIADAPSHTDAAAEKSSSEPDASSSQVSAPPGVGSVVDDPVGARLGSDGPPTEVVVEMPPSWFVQWRGNELAHDFFVRGVPLARAALVREGAAQLASRRVRVLTNEAREPDTIAVFLPSGIKVVGGFAVWNQWYCPEEWLPALRDARLHEPAPWPGIHAVSAPIDATDAITSWSAPETVARMIFRTVRAAEEKEDAP